MMSGTLVLVVMVSVGERVGDGEAVGDAPVYSCLELNGAHDPRGCTCGLEGDVVEKVLPQVSLQVSDECMFLPTSSENCGTLTFGLKVTLMGKSPPS